jgi:hypothetical protein
MIGVAIIKTMIIASIYELMIFILLEVRIVVLLIGIFINLFIFIVFAFGFMLNTFIIVMNLFGMTNHCILLFGYYL